MLFWQVHSCTVITDPGSPLRSNLLSGLPLLLSDQPTNAMKHFFSILCILLLASCVGSKKHREAITALQQDYESQLAQLNDQFNTERARSSQLSLDLVKCQGANEALLLTQDKLQDRIDQLQAEMDRMGSRATNQSSELQQREDEIARLRQHLTDIRQHISRWEQTQQMVAAEISSALQPFEASLYRVETRAGTIVVTFNEKMLFATGSTSRLEQRGIDALKAVSDILTKYPNLYIQIIGHTDNRPVARKSLDNWDYTLLRAGNIAKLLIDDLDVGANRVLPAAKGEYAPRTSNETEAGRAENRRLELVISNREQDLARELLRKLDSI